MTDRAALVVCACASGVDEARNLLEMLGLIEAEPRVARRRIGFAVPPGYRPGMLWPLQSSPPVSGGPTECDLDYMLANGYARRITAEAS